MNFNRQEVKENIDARNVKSHSRWRSSMTQLLGAEFKLPGSSYIERVEARGNLGIAKKLRGKLKDMEAFSINQEIKELDMLIAKAKSESSDQIQALECLKAELMVRRGNLEAVK